MHEAANPFADAIAVANSNYAALERGRLVHPASGEPVSALTAFVHDELRALVLNERFTCMGGKAALRQGTYRFGLYGDMTSAAAAGGLAHDLFTFTGDIRAMDGGFTTFLASFTGPNPPDERSFEQTLWRMLQRLHDLDAPHHEWDPAVSDNPADPQFSFSFGGVAFFVVGLHAASSRVARRFAWPTLVFNPHQQFEALKNSGHYPRLQQVIRRAERQLQGDTNPMLADYGARSEAAQYSGRRVEAEWKCPFHAHDRNPTTD
jgi:FPC/CPF motif-containing protein YcgG